jgi:hypothetical protein
MLRCPLLVTALLTLAAGCGGGDDEGSSAQPEGSERSEQSESATPAPPPDAGTQTGHGADRPRQVEVPRSDASPPRATIVLESPAGRPRTRASEPGKPGGPTVRLSGAELHGTTVALDENGGVARVRVSVREEVRCAGGEERLRTRYFPPPQVERIRSNPGALLPTRKVRSMQIELSRERCPGRVAEIRGELWGEAINGSGLEAVTPHLRFRFVARAAG